MLDASVAVSWFFEDQRDKNSLAMAAAVTEQGAVVPPLFRWEVQNALMMAVRRKRMSNEQLEISLESLDELTLAVDDWVITSPLTTGLKFAQRFRLTAYDAAYLEVAVRRSLLIMTRDRQLISAAADLRLLWKP